MQLRVLEKEPNKIVIEVNGEGHTLCNLLESVLLEDEDVKLASYNISHPLVAKPVIIVQTKENKSPEAALKETVEKILERGRKLKEEFEKAFKSSE